MTQPVFEELTQNQLMTQVDSERLTHDSTCFPILSIQINSLLKRKTFQSRLMIRLWVIPMSRYATPSHFEISIFWRRKFAYYLSFEKGKYQVTVFHYRNCCVVHSEKDIPTQNCYFLKELIHWRHRCGRGYYRSSLPFLDPPVFKMMRTQKSTATCATFSATVKGRRYKRLWPNVAICLWKLIACQPAHHLCRRLRVKTWDLYLAQENYE